MSDEMIVLVDQKDNYIGELSKIEVHKKGLLQEPFQYLFLTQVIKFFCKKV